MKSRTHLYLLLGLFSITNVAYANVSKLYVDGEVLIKYKSSSSVETINHSLNQIVGMQLRTVGGDSHLLRVKLISNQTVESALFSLQKDPNVEYAQPNYLYHAAGVVTPNDPLFSQQWSLSNTGQTVVATSGGPDSPDSTGNPGTSRDDMSLTQAWSHITDCSSVIVAVLDTGIDYNHQDLVANMWNGTVAGYSLHGTNFQDGTEDPMDDNGHGTHVAGIIGAVGNNGIGSSGICWKASLMAVKVLDSTGTGSTSTIADGMNWAIQHNAKVLNLSLGSNADDAALDAAITGSLDAGAVVVAAAGNDNGSNNDVTPFYPCNSASPNVICVAAVDQQFNLASFSDYGPKSVHVGAPGINIVSTWPYSATVMTDDFSGWSYTSNTSAQGWGNAYTSNYGALEPVLSDPYNWGTSGAEYKPITNDHAYKIFNLSGSYDKVTFQYYQGYDFSGVDNVKTYVNATGGDPTTSGVLQDTESGSTGSTAYLKSYNLLSYCPSEAPTVCSCNTVTCSIGFQFQSFSTATDSGVFVIRFEVLQSSYATNVYDVLEGTSMAAPHVSGLAAMLFAFQPNYTWSDVAYSIKYGGTADPSLSGKTVTGNAVNAMGSLQFVLPPQGVSVQKL